MVGEFVELFEKNARFVGVGTDYEAPDQDSPFTPNGALRSAPSIEIVGRPADETSKELRCFIAIPFRERDEDRPIGFFAEVLESLLTPAITDAGFEAFTARRQ